MEEKELLHIAKQGNEQAINDILMGYKPLVLAVCRKYFLINDEQDDLIQEGMIGLFNAICSFKENSTTSFKTYATTCVKNKIQSALIKNNRYKNLPINTYCSITNQGKILLSSTKENENESEEDCGFFLEANNLSPEESMLFREKLTEIVRKANANLSDYEREVLALFVSGLNYVEIAKKLKKEPKSIDNALSRIKIKLKDLKGGI